MVFTNQNLIGTIFSYLSLSDCANFVMTSRIHFELTKNRRLWLDVIKNVFPYLIIRKNCTLDDIKTIYAHTKSGSINTPVITYKLGVLGVLENIEYSTLAEDRYVKQAGLLGFLGNPIVLDVISRICVVGVPTLASFKHCLKYSNT